MSRLLEWVKHTLYNLETEDVILGIAIGTVIFFVLLVVAIFIALFGPVTVITIFILLLCIGMGVLIAGSLL